MPKCLDYSTAVIGTRSNESPWNIELVQRLWTSSLVDWKLPGGYPWTDSRKIFRVFDRRYWTIAPLVFFTFFFFNIVIFSIFRLVPSQIFTNVNFRRTVSLKRIVCKCKYQTDTVVTKYFFKLTKILKNVYRFFTKNPCFDTCEQVGACVSIKRKNKRTTLFNCRATGIEISVYGVERVQHHQPSSLIATKSSRDRSILRFGLRNGFFSGTTRFTWQLPDRRGCFTSKTVPRESQRRQNGPVVFQVSLQLVGMQIMSREDRAITRRATIKYVHSAA